MPDTLAEITALLSAASGPSDAVTGISNLLTEGLKLIEPILSNDETQQYETQRKARITKAAELVSELLANPGPDAEQRLSAFDEQLHLDAGFPLAGGVPGPVITIRVDRYLTFVAEVAELISDKAYLTSLIQNAVKPAVQK